VAGDTGGDRGAPQRMTGLGRPEHDDPGPAPAGDAPDDVDRLYARLSPLPAPRTFVADVMLAVHGARPEAVARLGPREAAWALAGVVSLVLAALLAFVAGQALVSGGTIDLLSAIAGDTGVFAAAPGITLLALADAFPWIETLALLGTLLLVAYCARRLGRALAPGPAPLAGRRATRGV